MYYLAKNDIILNIIIINKMVRILYYLIMQYSMKINGSAINNNNPCPYQFAQINSGSTERMDINVYIMYVLLLCKHVNFVVKNEKFQIYRLNGD